MATEWQLSRRSDHCLGCKTALAPGSIYHAYLYEVGESYERRDYCTQCPPPADPPAVGFWRARRPAAGEAPPSATHFDREAVFAFFQRLGDPDTAEKRQFRFVLALLLWRRKVLKLNRTDPPTDAQPEVWHFTAAHVAEQYRVERPDLSDDDASRLSAHVEKLLSTGAMAEELADAAPAADAAAMEPARA